MLLDQEILKTIPEGELREWARVNGCSMESFDVVYDAWLVANSLDNANTVSEPIEEV